MRITNFGSCNIDKVYAVPWFVKPGETLPCSEFEIYPGGKGLNQSLALAYAGADVRHAGKIGQDGIFMRQLLAEAGVDVTHLSVSNEPSGHALIQVTPQGDNAIVIFGGANQSIGAHDIYEVLCDTRPGEFLLLQNEISCLPELINAAHEKQQRIIFNAAPVTDEVNNYPLDKIEVFIINEIEAENLTGETEPDSILDRMAVTFPDSRTILTLGGKGAVYGDSSQRVSQHAFDVRAVDTTAAGDTFTGYFLAGFIAGQAIEDCLAMACRAAALCVTKPGAASSIPRRPELNQDLVRR
ncbi:MAG: ribokinase [Pseudomonadales bacterium]